MRFMLAADLHGGTNRYNVPTPSVLGSSRLDEFEQVLDRLATSAIETGCHFVFIGGDLFDHRHPTPTMLRIVTAFCARMAKADVTVLIVPGNHDGPHALGTETTHTLYWLKALDLPGIRVYTRPTIETFARDDGLTVVAMPYPHRRALDGGGPLAPAGLPEDRVIEAGRKMEELIRAYGRQARANDYGRVVFLGHMTVLGSRTASETLMRMEWDIAVEPSAFEDFDFVALGHIHKMQGIGTAYDDIRFEDAPAANIWYPGSPVYLDFGESDQPKGFLLVELTPQGSTIARVRSDPREMVRVRLEYLPGIPADALSGLEALDGTMVELTITGDTPPPESWVEQTERLFRAHAFILKTVMRITPREAVAALTVPEEEDLTNKEVALAQYLRLRQLPSEPYMTLGRSVIEAHR